MRDDNEANQSVNEVTIRIEDSEESHNKKGIGDVREEVRLCVELGLIGKRSIDTVLSVILLNMRVTPCDCEDGKTNAAGISHQ